MVSQLFSTQPPVTEATGQPTISHQTFMSIKLATLGVLGNTRPVRGDAHEAVSCLHVRLELRAQWGDLLVALGPAPTMTREDGRVSRAGVGRAPGPATLAAAPSGLVWRGAGGGAHRGRH